MMDPERIDRIINKLRALWHTYPDQRLGQLLINTGISSENVFMDVFYRDDEDTEKLIEKFASEAKGSQPAP